MKTPLEAIRAQCVECVGGAVKEIATCDCRCAFHKYRMGKGKPSVKVIRAFCMECMCGAHSAVRECQTETCPLWIYRFGVRPAFTASQMKKISRRRSVPEPVISRRRTKIS